MKALISLLFLFSIVFAKQDFFYGFMDNSGKQIDLKTKKQIKNGFSALDNIRRIMNDGEVQDALNLILEFEKSNKQPLLKSDAILLKSEILLRLESKRYILDGEKLLENAINSAQIKEENLVDAYILLTKLKVHANKANEAKYFATAIIENFDDPLKQAYGKIAMSEISIYQKDYGKATKMLYEVLSKTNDITIATIVADKLFDVYLADNQPEKAYELIQKVLKTNIGFYLNDVHFAIKKADQLIKADMPELGIQILEEVLKKTTNPQTIEKIKIRLAEAYMTIIDLPKAKEYYKDILNDYPASPSAQKAKMAIDEILMREGKIEPAIVADKYKDSTAMQQKALFQELLIDKGQKKYEHILKSKKVYDKISDQIALRFGYTTVQEVYNDVQLALIKEYLQEGKCEDLERATRDAKPEVLKMLITDDNIKKSFFECAVKFPSLKIYDIADEAFKDSRNAEVYLYLEKIAFGLDMFEESLAYSKKVEMVNNKSVLEQEFLQKYLLAKTLGDPKFVAEVLHSGIKNPSYIETNKNSPLILDFYYDYYLYLLEEKQDGLASDIVAKMYQYKKAKKIRVFSPFVEMALADKEKAKKNYKQEIAYLEEGLKSARRIKSNDLARTYYELTKAYQAIGQNQQAAEYTKKCKSVNDNDSIWKKMCDRL